MFLWNELVIILELELELVSMFPHKNEQENEVFDKSHREAAQVLLSYR
jgi:hypothetical protein